MLKQNSPLGRFMSGLLDQFLLNLLYFVFCVPIITIGAATAALYKVQFDIRAGEHPSVFSAFYHGFISNFKQGTVTFLFLAVAGMFIAASVFAAMTVGIFGYMLTRVVILIVGFLFISVWGWVFPLISKFEYSALGTLRNAYLLSVQSLPTSLVIIVVNLFVPLLFFSLPEGLLGIYLFWIMFFHAAVASMINCRMIWKALKKYMPEEEKEEENG